MQEVDCSLIVAAYNMAPYIEEAVASALAQEGVDLEVIVVDDNSDDETAAIVSAIAAVDSRVKLVRNGGKKGAAGARNQGLGVARGRWIAILDADDTIAPYRVATLIDLAERMGVDIISDNLELNTPYGSPEVLLRGRHWLVPKLVSAQQYLRCNRILGAGTNLGFLKPMFSRDFLSHYAICYDTSLKVGEDFDICLRCLVKGARFLVSPEVMYRYLLRSDSLSRSLSKDDVRALLHSNDIIQKGLDPETRRSLRRAFSIFRRALENGIAYIEFRDALRKRKVLPILLCAIRPRLLLGAIEVASGVARRGLSQAANHRNPAAKSM